MGKPHQFASNSATKNICSCGGSPVVLYTWDWPATCYWFKTGSGFIWSSHQKSDRSSQVPNPRHMQCLHMIAFQTVRDKYGILKNLIYSWFQTFAVFWILYVFFWVFPRRLIVVCRRFGTLYLFHLHRLDMKYFISNLWGWNIQSVPNRLHTTIKRRGITQKSTYKIQNTAKVWNQK